VCPDRDKNGGTLVDVALNNNWSVSFPLWENGIKDAAKATEKYGRILTLQSILDSAEENPTTIKHKWNLGKHGRHKKL